MVMIEYGLERWKVGLRFSVVVRKGISYIQ